MADDKKSPLQSFMERIYRLKTFKGQLEEVYFILEKPMDIVEIIGMCKKWCNTHHCRFMGVKPMFEVLKDE